MNEHLRQMALALLATVGVWEPNIRRHSERVALLAVNIAGELGIDSEDMDNVWLAGNVHDIGKVAIPGEVLHKNAVLSAYERSLSESHVKVGLDILREGSFPWGIQAIVAQHHERLDGSGYPHGLKGDEIVTGARILAVADVFDAMTSVRPYRIAFLTKETCRYFEHQKGALFDSTVVDALTVALPKMRLFATP